MKLKPLRFTSNPIRPMHGDASKPRGFFATGSMNMPSYANM